jgi:3-phenylpropionate/trans-cinnamate dioxygenase ferredoxin subunit
MNRMIAIPSASLPAPGMRSLCRVEDLCIALFNIAGNLYAIDDRCPHAGSSLASGKLDGLNVQCPAHGLRFNLATGCMPGGRGLSVRSYTIEVRDDQAFVSLPEASGNS